jgi:preprotein translocase subunit YajC
LNGLLSLLAQAQPPATGGAPQPGGIFGFLIQYGPLLIILLIMYTIFLGPKRKQDRERQTMLGQMKKGDRVQTIGGLIGTVMDVREDRVVLKIDESSNAKATYVKSAIHKVLTEDAKPA